MRNALLVVKPKLLNPTSGTNKTRRRVNLQQSIILLFEGSTTRPHDNHIRTSSLQDRVCVPMLPEWAFALHTNELHQMANTAFLSGELN